MDDKIVPRVPREELTAIIRRLEAATSRLEDIAAATSEPSTTNAPSAIVGAPSLPAPTGPLPPPPTSQAAPPKSVEEPTPASVGEFDGFLAGALKKYVTLSEALGGSIASQALQVQKAFEAQRKFLLISTKAKKPPMDDSFFTLIKPMQEACAEVDKIKDTNRGKPEYDHLSTVAESIQVIGWFGAEAKPHKQIEDGIGSAQYWGNRILKKYKTEDPKQVEWVQAYYQVLRDLTEYVKETFPMGIPWNPKGVSVAEASKSLDQKPSTPAPSVGGPPPPPPPPGPPPPPIRFDDAPKVAPQPAAGGDLGAVFSELNKGADVTKGLRKVNADQMTHKNPSLRAGAIVPQRSDSASSSSSISRAKSPAPGKKPKPESMRQKKPPVKRLDGNKWIIENYENEPNPIEIEAEISHSILITRCSKTTIVVKGKFNAVSIDNSPRLSIVVDSLVSSVDVIKCNNFALQVLGTLPTILMDQVDGATIYLSKDSSNTELFTSKTTGVNLILLKGDDEDEKEVPLPEQIRTYITPEGLVKSEIVEHSG